MDEISNNLSRSDDHASKDNLIFGTQKDKTIS